MGAPPPPPPPPFPGCAGVVVPGWLGCVPPLPPPPPGMGACGAGVDGAGTSTGRTTTTCCGTLVGLLGWLGSCSDDEPLHPVTATAATYVARTSLRMTTPRTKRALETMARI